MKKIEDLQEELIGELYHLVKTLKEENESLKLELKKAPRMVSTTTTWFKNEKVQDSNNDKLWNTIFNDNDKE